MNELDLVQVSITQVWMGWDWFWLFVSGWALQVSCLNDLDFHYGIDQVWIKGVGLCYVILCMCLIVYHGCLPSLSLAGNVCTNCDHNNLIIRQFAINTNTKDWSVSKFLSCPDGIWLKSVAVVLFSASSANTLYVSSWQNPENEI